MKRLARSILGIVLAALLLASSAPPSLAGAKALATRCCADHCGHSRSGAAADRCCKIVQARSEVAVVAAREDAHPAASHVTAAVVPSGALRPAGAIRRLTPAGRALRAAPIFLQTLSLRL